MLLIDRLIRSKRRANSQQCCRPWAIQAASIHRTYLTASGERAPVQTVKKFVAGKPLNSSAIRFGLPDGYTGIAEGTATALAASRRFGLLVCAATDVVLLESWVPPNGVTDGLIAGDNDANYTGQSAAFALARRLVSLATGSQSRSRQRSGRITG